MSGVLKRAKSQNRQYRSGSVKCLHISKQYLQGASLESSLQEKHMLLMHRGGQMSKGTTST